jgi:hypothetical protein
MPISCPRCDRSADKVIYYGLPMRLCESEYCACLFGRWAWIALLLPFNGLFFVYRCSYPVALWIWLTKEW